MRLAVAGNEVYAYTGARPLDAALPTVVFVHGAAERPQRLGAAVALLRASRPERARRRPAGPRPLRRCARSPSVAAIADWIPALLDAAKIDQAALVGHSLGSLAALECAARHSARVTKVALVGPAAPMPVAEPLLDAAKRNDHVAFELINGWSYSAGKKLGGNRCRASG